MASSSDFRSQLIEAVESGLVTWEAVARTFIVQASNSQCQDVVEELTDNEGFGL